MTTLNDSVIFFSSSSSRRAWTVICVAGCWTKNPRPSEAATLADQHVAVHIAGRPGLSSRFGKSGQFPPRGSPSKQQPQSSRPQNAASSTTNETHQTSSVGAKPKFSDPVFRGTHRIVCHYCKKPGHILANCRKRLDKLSGKTSEEAPVHLVSTLSKPQAVDVVPDAVFPQKEPSPNPRFERHCIQADLIKPDASSKRVRLLRDTGALQSLICSQILTDADYVSTGEFRFIRGVTGDIVSVPLVKVTLTSSMCCGTFLCGVVCTLPSGVAILVGNDICSDDPVTDVSVVTRSQTAQQKQAITPGAVPTSQSDDEAGPSTSPVPENDDNVADLSPLFDDPSVDWPTSLETVDRVELIRLQQLDSDLAALLDLVDRPDHPYTLRSGVLVRAWRDELSPREATFHQIVVPTVLRAKLLHIAHEISAAGHLAVAKTKDRLLRHSYWPSISRDVKNFCRSCDVCQRLGKGALNSPAPLHSLPIVSEPFCQIAIDIVGPLPSVKILVTGLFSQSLTCVHIIQRPSI